MSAKALLLVTINILSMGNNDNVATTSTLLDDSTQCSAAMRQVVEHHGLQNNIFSQGKEYLKARKSITKGLVTLTINCKELK